MQQRSHALMTGLFILGIGALFATLWYWLADHGPEQQPYILVTKHSVAGLTEQASVSYRGIPVGSVKKIRFDTEQPERTLVYVMIDVGTPMQTTTEGNLRMEGVTGLANIELDHSAGGQALPTSLENPAELPLNALWVDALQSAATTLFEKAESIVQKVDSVVSEENVHALRETIARLNSAVSEFEQVAVDLRPAITKLPNTLEEAEAAFDSVDSAAADLKKLLQQASGLLPKAEQVMANTERLTGNFAKTSDELSAAILPEAEKTMGQIRRTAQALEELVEQLEDRPQGLIFGPGERRPGPGEQGYTR